MTVAPQTGWPPTVGRYLLYGEIASGGMATVHFGRLQGAAGFARSVAIKRLHPQYAKDPDFVGMFLDEARLAARIAHPNVVPTLDIVSQGDELLLVMEYVRGSSLSRLLRTLTQKGERMPVRTASAILAGVLRGLHAAHEAKSEGGERLEIVHRDVSPQNVLVGTDGIARVLDFGVAKAAGRVQTTREGQLKGKLAYMAPEQITTGSVTRKTDVYAAAVVLWEMLTGRRLFRADNEAKLLALVLDSEVLPPSSVVEGLPSGFDQVVMKGLDRDPSKRYATAREMAIDVEGVVGIEHPTEVGEWVEIVAADELRERANRIEEIERSVIGSSPSGVSPAWSDAAPANFVSRRPDEPSTVQHGGRATTLPPVPRPPKLPAALKGLPPTSPPTSAPAVSPARPVSVSQVSNLAVAHTEPPKHSRKRPAGIMVAAALAACAVGATVMALRPLHPNAAISSSPAIASPPSAPPLPATTAEPSAMGGTAPTTPARPAVGTVTPSSATMGGRAEAPPLPVKVGPRPPQAYAPPVAPGAPAPSPPSGGVTGAIAPPPPRPAPGPRPGQPPAVSADCNPPYTTDDKGHIHFKPSCVN